MRVVVGERVGGPEVLTIAEREAPRPGPGEVVVEVAAAGVNYMDIYQREGVGNYRADPPFVPGGEGGEKVELALGAGADHVVGYDRFRDIVDDASNGAGAHVVYDGVGKDTFDDSLAALRPRGMMVLYGAASGQVPPVDPQRLNSGGSLFLTRPTLVHYIADRTELRWRAGEVFDWITKGELDVRIGGTYPLSEAARAQEDLAGRRTTGKLLLLPGL